MNLGVRVEGLDKLHKRLANLSAKVQGKTLRKGLKAAGKPILDEVRNNVPVDSGLTKQDVKATTSVSRKGGAYVRVGFRRRKHIASFLEFGTRKMRAQPFMRPAFDSTKGQAVEEFRTTLGEAIKALDSGDG